MFRTSRLALVSLSLTALIAAGCSSGSSDDSSGVLSTASATTEPADATTTTPAPPTTVDPTELATAYADFGPYPVGVTTLQLAKGPKVEVWYPAVEGTSGTETYDVREFTPEVIRALLTGDASATYSYPAGRDAEVAEGTYPVVLFSHGFTGIRVQSAFLTSHLASWGMIVVSPDHPSRDLSNVLGGTASGDRADAVDDLLQSLDLITSANDDPASRFAGHVDAELVVAVGHSAGGGTVLAAADDARIDGYVSLASGAALAGDGSSTSVPPTLPAKPSFFMAGSTDAVVPAETRTRPSWEAAPSPSLLWILDGVGHNGFDDFCTFGNGTGIIGVAEASGLGPVLDAQPQLRTLGEDGCIPPSVPVSTSFPVITHGVTAWIRALFGVDAEPVGIGADVADAFAVPVEISEK
ncbi:MAG: chlorophyllase/cutinase-like alpha/beta fold protein [Ilumatobacteraceae bacterium]